MKPSTKYSPEVRERAVKLVLDHQSEHDSQWSAIVSVSSKLGCTSETLRKWVRQAEHALRGPCGVFARLDVHGVSLRQAARIVGVGGPGFDRAARALAFVADLDSGAVRPREVFQVEAGRYAGAGPDFAALVGELDERGFTAGPVCGQARIEPRMLAKVRLGHVPHYAAGRRLERYVEMVRAGEVAPEPAADRPGPGPAPKRVPKPSRRERRELRRDRLRPWCYAARRPETASRKPSSKPSSLAMRSRISPWLAASLSMRSRISPWLAASPSMRSRISPWPAARSSMRAVRSRRMPRPTFTIRVASPTTARITTPARLAVAMRSEPSMPG